MSRIIVLYYSRTGNTEKMAKAVAEGATIDDRVIVELSYHTDAEELANFDAILIGAPTYHHDTPIDMKKLFEAAATKNINLKGKIGAAFGSYGWSGEAPKLLLEIMKNRFGMQIVAPPLLTKYVPDKNALENCRELGKNVSESLMHQT